VLEHQFPWGFGSFQQAMPDPLPSIRAHFKRNAIPKSSALLSEISRCPAFGPSGIRWWCACACADICWYVSIYPDAGC